MNKGGEMLAKNKLVIWFILVIFFLKIDFKILSAQEKEYISDKNTIGLWHFNEEFYDSSENKNHLKIVGKYSWTDGKFGKGLLLNGEGYVTVKSSGSLNEPCTQITVEAWVKMTDISKKNMGIVVKFLPKRETGYGLKILDNKLLFQISFQDGTRSHIYGPKFTKEDENKWFHLAGTYDGECIKLFINGKLVAYKSIGSHIIESGENPLYIGGPSDSFFYGVIDEVRISNIARIFEEKKEPATSYKKENIVEKVAEKVIFAQNIIEAKETIEKPPYIVKEKKTPTITFDNLDGWKVLCYKGARAKFCRISERKVYDRPVAKIEWNASSSGGWIEIIPPSPIEIKENVDTVAAWIHGNPRWHNGKLRAKFVSSKKTTAILKIKLIDNTGKDVVIDIGPINWVSWFYVRQRLGKILKSGSKFIGLELHNPKVSDVEDFFANGDIFYFDSIYFFKASSNPLPDEYKLPQNLPFPTTPDTILPTFKLQGKNWVEKIKDGYTFNYEGEDCRIAYVYQPKKGTLEDITIIYNNHLFFKPMAGSGVWFEFGGEELKEIPVIKQGDRYTHKKGSKLYGPEDITPLLLSENFDGKELKIWWKWEKEGEYATLNYSFKIKQKSLIIEIISPEGKAVSLYYGYSENTPDAKVVYVPYLNIGPGILCFNNVFLTLVADWYVSNASFWPGYPGKGKIKEGAFEFAYFRNQKGLCFEYEPKTNGERNPLYERIFLNLSPDFHEVLPNIPNPPSPMGHITKNRLYLMFTDAPLPDREEVGYDKARDYSKYFKEKAQLLKSYGLDYIICMHHARMYSNYTGGTTAYTMNPHINPWQEGGLKALVEYMKYLKSINWIPGVYTGYWHIQPIGPSWDEDAVAHKPDGNWNPIYYYQSYLVKYSAAPALCEKWSPLIRDTFQAQAVYQDGTTANRPAAYMDYDARAEGAGTVNAVLKGYGATLLKEREIIKGPVFSEGGGHMYYAGLCDGNYAYDIEYVRTKNFSPLLVDFDLLKIHPLQTDIMMHYVHYGEDMDRWIAAAVAFGHMGYAGRLPLSPDFEQHTDIPATLRVYYMMQQLQNYYLLEKVKNIRYFDGKELIDSSSAIITDAYKRSQVYVEYETGLKIWVNGNFEENWIVKVNEREYILPPAGYLGVLEGKIEVFSGLKDGYRIDYAYTPEYVYVDGRGVFTKFKGISTDGQVVVKKENNNLRIIPVGKVKKIIIEPFYFNMDKKIFYITKYDAIKRKKISSVKVIGKEIEIDTEILSSNYGEVKHFIIN